jgi:hypothetical protein
MCDKPLPYKPRWTEVKVRIYRSWFAVVGFDLGDWTVGFGFEVAPAELGVGLGPLSIGTERDEPLPNYDDLPDWGGTLWRHVIRKWKLDIRLELDLNIWRVATPWPMCMIMGYTSGH